MIASSPTDSDLDQTFERLAGIMLSDQFLQSSTIDGEVPLFIQPYDIRIQTGVEKRIAALVSRLSGKGKCVLSINLLELVAEFTSKEGRLQRLLEMEPTFTRAKMLSTMSRWTDSKTHLVPAIIEKFAAVDWDLTLIYGCGAVFPYIRTHTVMENLQMHMDKRPVVFFFPGEYQHREAAGSELRLFGKLSHRGYYRAFNLDHYHL